MFLKTIRGILYHGNALEVLRKLPANSIDCVITSPPYYKKRDYSELAVAVWGGKRDCNHEWEERTELNSQGGLNVQKASVGKDKMCLGRFYIKHATCKKCGAWRGQLGAEPTPRMYVDHLVAIFREIKRVLKDTGNLFVNLDDTWQNKGLLLIPEKFAIAMVEDGWILRERIVWAKKVHAFREKRTMGNAMPESTKDRLAHTWEFVFHFTKSRKYYFNLDAVRVPFSNETIARAYRATYSSKLNGSYKGLTRKKMRKFSEKIRSLLEGGYKSPRSPGYRLVKILATGKENEKTLVRKALGDVNGYLMKKLRESGLTVKQLSEITGIKETTLAHYFRTDASGAALPSRDIWNTLKPILKLDDYDLHVKEEYKSIIPSPHPLGANPGDVLFLTLRPFHGAHFAVFPPDLPRFFILAGCPPGGVVLDPFAGAGTTLVIAEELRRKWIGIEINGEYCELIKSRIFSLGPLVKMKKLDDYT